MKCPEHRLEVETRDCPHVTYCAVTLRHCKTNPIYTIVDYTKIGDTTLTQWRKKPAEPLYEERLASAEPVEHVGGLPTPTPRNDGLRYSAGKPRYDLIPPAPLKALAEHFAAGSTKYAERNWEAGMDWGHMIRAADSHFTEWKLGFSIEAKDHQMPEGYRAHHLISAIWNLWTLYEYERRKIGVDSRPRLQFEDFQESEA